MKILKSVLLIVASILGLISCEKKDKMELKKGVVFSGITKKLRASSDLQLLDKYYDPVDTIKIDQFGKIQDTIQVEYGTYSLRGKGFYTILYLEEGYELVIEDSDNLSVSPIIFVGKGAEENNYLLKKITESERPLMMAFGPTYGGDRDEKRFCEACGFYSKRKKVVLGEIW